MTAQFTVTDATGAAFQLSSALFSADGRPHVLTASLGGTHAAYPLRLSQVILFYTLPAKRLKAPVTLTIAGATPSTWTAVASSPELVSQLSTGHVYGPSGRPAGDRLAARARWRDAHVHPRLRAMGGNIRVTGPSPSR